MLLLAAVSNIAFVGMAHGEESPVEVATRFVEALAGQDYDEVVECVYEPWMHSELDMLDVRMQRSFRELNLAFSLHRNAAEQWRITSVRSELVAE